MITNVSIYLHYISLIVRWSVVNLLNVSFFLTLVYCHKIVYYGRICSNFYLICAIIFKKNEMNYCKFLRVKKIKRHLEQQEQGDGFIYNIEIRDGNATNFRAAFAFGFSLIIRKKNRINQRIFAFAFRNLAIF